MQIGAGADAKATTAVTRTVLEDGIERSAELGELAPEGIVALPGQSIVTVTLQR